MGSQQLTFDGDLELIDVGGGSDGGYTIQAVDGMRFGNPVPREVIIASFLRDGSIVSKDGDENREMAIPVRVSAPDGVALAAGEARLNLATGKRTTLAWTPPDGIGPTTVFDVLTSSLGRVEDGWDLDEIRGARTYVLRLVCLPFGRSVDLTTVTAEGIPSVGTTVNAADSTTNWSTPTAVIPGATFGSYVDASPQPADMLAVDSSTFVEGTGSIAAKAWKVYPNRYGAGFLPSGDARQVDTSLTLTQAIAVGAGAYLSFAVKFDSTWGRTVDDTYWGRTHQQFGTLDTFTVATATELRVYKNDQSAAGDLLLTDGIVEALGEGWTRYTFRIDDALSVTSLSWTSQHLVPWDDDADAVERPRILVDQVAVTESATLGNQVLSTINVGGSARTTGALHVAAPSDSVALGQVLAFTIPQSRVALGWRPDLAQWVDGAATTGTVGGKSGVFNAIGASYGSAGSPVFTAPASSFKAGAYSVAGSVYRVSNTTLAFTIEASLMLGATVVATEELVVDTTVAATEVWEMHVLGTLYLPPTLIQFASPDATVRFRFKGANEPVLEDLYVFPVEGDLTIIDCGSGAVGPAASSHLWIDSPSPEQPQGGYWRGTDPTRGDALAAWSATVVPGTHTFEAGEMLAFAASSDAAGPTVTFDYHKAWFGNAGE